MTFHNDSYCIIEILDLIPRIPISSLRSVYSTSKWDRSKGHSRDSGVRWPLTPPTPRPSLPLARWFRSTVTMTSLSPSTEWRPCLHRSVPSSGTTSACASLARRSLLPWVKLRSIIVLLFTYMFTLCQFSLVSNFRFHYNRLVVYLLCLLQLSYTLIMMLLLLTLWCSCVSSTYRGVFSILQHI